jgi:hypothetical protein
VVEQPTATPITGIITVTADRVTQSSGAPPITSTLTSIFQSELMYAPVLHEYHFSCLTFFFRASDDNGMLFTTTLQMTVIIVPTGPSSSKSHTGAIAGGAAGGIIALAAAIIIFIFCWRRRRDEDPNGTFDPSRIIRPAGGAGHTDIQGAEITPYNYDPQSTLSGTTSPTFSPDGSMQQYHDSQGLLGSTYGGPGGATASSSGSQYAPTSSDPSAPLGQSTHARSTSYSSAGSPPGFPVAQPYRPLSRKEAELRRRGEGGLGLASAPEEGEDKIILQHSDGGRITEPEPPSVPTQEIPPSYYSIPGNPY